MKKKRKLKKIWNKDLIKIFLTALITSILTLVSSYFLMFSQLEKEQEYWITRMKTERLQEMLDRQIKLYEEINNGVLSIEVLAKDFKISATDFIANVEMAVEFQDENIIKMNAFLTSKALGYHKQINSLASKLQMAEFYFGQEVDTLIKPLSDALERNYNTNLIIGDSENTKDLDSVIEYFKRDFNTIEELTEKRLEILKAMRNEMDLISKYLYKNE